MTDLFKPYEYSDYPNLTDIRLPEEITGAEIEYMIFTLCNGDVTKKNFIECNLDITDYFEWVCFMKYKNFVEHEAIRRMRKNL